ncbi:MAG: MptD family putative ECF transporter S component [Treponema sp.]|jgi:energy-coupling factor transport system substrate-specific component|nr:MptD family putative ECF transporter S component [Treponema sp.]
MTETKKTNRLTVKDIITVLILTILIVVFSFFMSSLTMFNHILNLVFTVGIILFIIAPVFLVMVHRVNKGGVMAIFMGIIAVIYIIMGYWYVGLLTVLAAIPCEIIMAKPDSYKRPWKNTVLFAIFGLSLLSTNFLPVWWFWEAFEKTALSGGMSAGYIQAYRDFYTNPPIVAGIIAFSLLASVMGCRAGYGLLNGYFKKAGLI